MQLSLTFRTIRTVSAVLALPIFLVASYSCGGLVAPSGPEATEQTRQASSQADAAAATIATPADPLPCVAWTNAVVANTGNVMLNAGTLIDSFQPAVGPYGGANAGSAASVEVATTLTNNGGIVHGLVTQHSPAGLSVIPVPAGATNLPLGYSSPGPLNINTAADDVTLPPGDYVAANINVNSPGAITVSPPGKVRIWVTGNLNLGGNENVGGNSQNLAFLVTSSGWVNVNSNGALYGLIYAPTSGINLDSVVYGAVIGSSVTLNSGAAVHLPQGRFANTLPNISTSVAYAELGITLGAGDQTVGGDIGVAVAGASSLGAQVTIGSRDCLDVSQTVYGPTVSLGSGAIVGDIDTNALTNSGGQFALEAPYPAGAMPLLPLTFGGAAGTNFITVAAGQSATLSPGSFGALVDDGLVFLNPGTYSFASITLGSNAQLQARPGGATTIFVAGALATGTGAQIIPLGQQAGTLTILVAGTDGTSGSPPAASLGANNQVIALLSVPHGTLSIGANSVCTGAFAGYNVVAGTNVTLQLQGGFPASSPSGLAIIPGPSVPPPAASAALIGPVPANSTISLGLELPIQNQPGFLTLLQELYDPTSPNFQQFKSPSYLAANFASPASYQSLVGWAQSQGLQIVQQNANNIFLLVSGPASAIENAFLVNLNLYQRAGGGQFYATDRKPFNPSAAPIMDVASGFNNFNLPAMNIVPASPLRPTSLDTGTGPCASMYGPDFRNLYAPGTTLTGQGQSVALFELDDFYNNDLQYYENLAQPPLSTISPERVQVGAPLSPSTNGNVEVIGDIDMVISMAPALDHVYVYEGNVSTLSLDTAAQTIFHEMQDTSGVLTASGDNVATANQVSSSWYGYDGYYIAKSLTLMAAAGQSVFLASGDFGANVSSNPSFTSSAENADASTCTGTACAIPGPYAHDPITLQAADGSMQSIDAVNYVTLVGGTESASSNGTNVTCISEQTWADSDLGYSGGGVIPNVSLPTYQNPTMFTPAPGGNNGSTTNRNFPDVAAMADAIWVQTNNGGGPGNCCQNNKIFPQGPCVNNAPGPIGGTSFAAPLWAGFTALIHEQRSSATLGPIGLLNPYLYNVIGTGPHYLDDMFDVQAGSNNPSTSDPTHYEAISGFDLATGWGSPRLGLISDLASPAPSPGLVTYDGADFIVGTGGDDLRCTSIAYVDLLDTSANELQRIYLKGEGQNSWANGSVSSVPATLSPPLSPTQIAFVKLSLNQGGGTCQLFTTSDNWNVASFTVNLTCSSCNNPVGLGIVMEPSLNVRLEDPGGNHTSSVTFPTNSACPVACASGTSCASQSDCTVGTCVGGTGIPGSGCCTQTMNACGCNSDCPAGETCFNDNANDDPNGMCGDTFAGTCM